MNCKKAKQIITILTIEMQMQLKLGKATSEKLFPNFIYVYGKTFPHHRKLFYSFLLSERN